jgi:hypothetical protein
VPLTVTETIPDTGDPSSMWQLTSISCNDGTVGTPPSVQVTLALAANVTCTFTNSHLGLNVDKDCGNLDFVGTPEDPVPAGSVRAEFTIEVQNTGTAALLVDIVDPDLEIDPANVDGDDVHTHSGITLGVPAGGSCDDGDYGDGSLDRASVVADAADGCVRLVVSFTQPDFNVPRFNEVMVSSDALADGTQVSLTDTADKLCKFTATRTRGFWSTHEDYTCHVAEVHLGIETNAINLGYTQAENCDDVFGIFYADNPWNEDGSRRERTCQASIITAAQLMAAILNTGLSNGSQVPVLQTCAAAPADPGCLDPGDLLYPYAGQDIISAAQMALMYCADISNVMCDRRAVIELGSRLGAYNEGDDDTIIWDADGYAVQPADPDAAAARADTAVADCGVDPAKKDKGGRRRGDGGTEPPPAGDWTKPPAPEPVALPVEAPVLEEVTPAEPVVEEVVPVEAPVEVAPVEPAPAVEASAEPAVESVESEPTTSELPGSIRYLAPTADELAAAAEAEVAELEEGETGAETSTALRVEHLTFLLDENGLGLSGLVKLSGVGAEAVLGDLRLTVSYRSADDLPWRVVDESAACALDRELPLALADTATVDLAFECSLSSAVPAGAAVRVRVEASDPEGGSAGREVAHGL